MKTNDDARRTAPRLDAPRPTPRKVFAPPRLERHAPLPAVTAGSVMI